MPADFDKKEYWHERFTRETAHEWLLSSASFMAILEPYLATLRSSARILHLGSGTSDLQNHLRARGFTNVTNVDYEPLAVQRGQDLERRAFGDVQMSYIVADATNLQLPARYALVLDKSTADAVSCAGADAVARMTDSVSRSLSHGGVWVSLSYSASRFEVDSLSLQVKVVAKVLTPKARSSDPDIYHWCYELKHSAA